MVRSRRKPITIVSAFINISLVFCILILHKENVVFLRRNLTMVERRAEVLRFSEQLHAESSLWDTTPCRLVNYRRVYLLVTNIYQIFINISQLLSPSSGYKQFILLEEVKFGRRHIASSKSQCLLIDVGNSSEDKKLYLWTDYQISLPSSNIFIKIVFTRKLRKIYICKIFAAILSLQFCPHDSYMNTQGAKCTKRIILSEVLTWKFISELQEKK